MWLKSKWTHLWSWFKKSNIIKISKYAYRQEQNYVVYRGHSVDLEHIKILKTQLLAIIHKNLRNCQYQVLVELKVKVSRKLNNWKSVKKQFNG